MKPTNETDVMKPSERLKRRIEKMRSVQGWTEPWAGGCFETAILDFLNEHAHVFTPAPVEERAGVIPEGAEEFVSDGMRALRFENEYSATVEVRVPAVGKYEYRWPDSEQLIGWFSLHEDWLPFAWIRSVWAEMRDEPKERGDWDAPYRLNGPAHFNREVPGALEQCDLPEGEWIEFYLAADVEAERARHAEEVEQQRAEAVRVAMATKQTLDEKDARIAELENILAESLISHGHDTPCAQMMAAGGALECECSLPDGMRDQLHEALTRAEKAEAEAAELREKVKSLYGQLDRIKSEYDNLAGGGPDPGFGVDPKDSSRLSDLRSCIDEHGVFPSEEAEDAGDYEAAIRHMGELCQERSCLFSETVRVDVRGGHRAGVEALNLKRFINHHCEISIRALFPIGEAAEVSKPEGRDS